MSAESTATEFTKEMLDRAIAQAYQKGGNSDVILMSVSASMAMQSLVKFEGRDRRRQKREWNKAWRKGRKIELANPRPKTARDWWLASTATPTSANT